MSDTQAPATGGQGTEGNTGALQTVAPVAPVSTGVVATQTSAPAVAPPTHEWLGNTDELTLGYVQNKGWDTPLKAVQSYQNLEKLLGADKANNAVIIPKSDADPKDWAQVFDRLGRPTAPDGYKFNSLPGADTQYQGQLAAKMYELGLTKAQGENLANWHNEQIGNILASQEAQRAQAFQTEQADLQTEWGQAYQQNLVQAQNAARGFGLEPEFIDKMSDAIGHKATMQFLQKVGSRMGEDSFVSGDTRQTGFSNALTPAQAKSAIQERMNSRDFVAKYLAKDPVAVKEMAQLHEFAYPSEKN